MIIIYGTKKTRKTMATIGPYNCNSCSNNNMFNIVRELTWFSLFYIPLVPFRTTYYRVCSTCGTEDLMESAQAKSMIEKAKTGE